MAFVKRKQAFIDIKDLKPGDSIGFYRAGGSYFHCGIYDGKGNVIHRGAEPGSGSGAAIDTNSSFAMFGKESNKAEIRKDDLRLVAGSSPVYRINMFDKVYTPRPRLDIVRWAEEQIGKKGYNVFFKNCQHFCTKARYNISFNMQVQEHIILKTEQPYEMNRTLVNIVNLPELPRQPVSYTTAEKNVFSFEGYVRYMSRHMDLDKLSKKGLCALASSSVAIHPILAALKNNTHTLFTETGNGFQRATIKFDQSENSTTPLCIRSEINITAHNSDMELLLAAKSSALRPLSIELKCTIGNSTVSNHLNVVRLEYTNFNSNPFCTATTSNCSIIDKGEISLPAADDRLYTNATSDTNILLPKILIESNTPWIREIYPGLNAWDIPVSTEMDGTFKVWQGQSFDRQNSTANSSTQWRANFSSVARDIGQVEIQEVVDDEEMRQRNFNLYNYRMVGGFVSCATIFFCLSWMLYLISLFLFIGSLFKVYEYISNLTAEQLFQSLLNILSFVLFIQLILLCIKSDVADITGIRPSTCNSETLHHVYSFLP